MILERSKLSSRQFWETLYDRDQGLPHSAWLPTRWDVELVQSELTVPSYSGQPGFWDVILRGYFCPPGLGLALFHPAHMGRKALPSALQPGPWLEIPLFLTSHPTWWVTVYEKQDSEHKVNARSWKAAVESCPHRREKDKRRKDRTGAKQEPHGKVREAKPRLFLVQLPSPAKAHRPRTTANASKTILEWPLGVTKQYNFKKKNVFSFLP